MCGEVTLAATNYGMLRLTCACGSQIYTSHTRVVLNWVRLHADSGQGRLLDVGA